MKPILFSQLYFEENVSKEKSQRGETAWTLCRVTWISDDGRVAEGVSLDKRHKKVVSAVSLLRREPPPRVVAVREQREVELDDDGLFEAASAEGGDGA